MTPRPVHQGDPTPLHPEHAQRPGPPQHREGAVQHHVTRELSAVGRSPHQPSQELEQEENGEDQLEAVEVGARDEFGLHAGTILLVADAVDGAEEEADGEQDSGDEGEVEAGGDT